MAGRQKGKGEDRVCCRVRAERRDRNSLRTRSRVREAVESSSADRKQNHILEECVEKGPRWG